MNPGSWLAALAAIAKAPHPPRPWRDGTQLPWHEPEFSARVLPIHLDPETHMASRSADVVSQHVAWLRRVATDRLPGTPAPHVVDLGCGPGLYCHALARAGWPTTGLDFSPAALAHARAVADAEHLSCAFRHADLTTFRQDDLADRPAADIVTFWFGEFHSFRPAIAQRLLDTVAAMLRPGGLFVLEYQPYGLFEQEDAQEWDALASSVFCDRPHLWLQEHAWDADDQAEITVHWIIEAETGRLQRYAQCHQAYADGILEDMLAAAGLHEDSRYGPITGVDPGFEFPMLITRREGGAV